MLIACEYNSTQQQNLDIDHYIYMWNRKCSIKQIKDHTFWFLFFFLGVFFMFPTMSYSTSLSGDAAIVSSVGTTRLVHDFASLNPLVSSFSPPPHSQSHHQQQQQNKIRKKRSLPGHPEPDAEVIALSPTSLLATNRFVCDFCNRGFRRDQNLQLHKRGHNLPWKLKQRSAKDVKKKAYVCPEPSCVHHHPSRALGDLTGIKKHYSRKHGEKKWKCQKCSKIYAVQSDWKAHSKTCGTREYRCDCGTLFSRKGSFITHRAFCEALAEESARLSAAAAAATNNPNYQDCHQLDDQQPYNSHIFANAFTPQNDFSHSFSLTDSLDPPPQNPNITTSPTQNLFQNKPDQENQNHHIPPMFFQDPPPTITSPFQNLHTRPVSNSVAEPLRQAATVTSVQQTQYSEGHATAARDLVEATNNNVGQAGFGSGRVLLGHISPQFPGMPAWKKSDGLTRDFLGLSTKNHGGSNVDVSVNVMDVLNFTGGGMELQPYEHDHSVLLNLKLRARGHGRYGFTEPPSGTWGNC